MPRRLLTRRWVLTHLVLLVVVAACVALGLWQLRRLEERRERNAAVTAGLDLPVRPIEEVGGEADYRRVTVRGAYDPAREYVLVGRSLDGTSGNHLVTPLYPVEGGPALIVDRGWVPEGSEEQAAPPDGPVELRGVLLPPEEGGSIGEGRTVVRVNTGLLGADLGREVRRDYLLLRDQEPAQPGPLPRAAPLPELGEGPHLSYAVQWFLFAAVAVGGWVVLVRRELRRYPSRGGGGMPSGQTQGSRE